MELAKLTNSENQTGSDLNTKHSIVDHLLPLHIVATGWMNDEL